ncbi:Molybdopterin binding motif CinA N-terminal domain [Paramagnetospirillum magnetotacticum MS-1]|uniref:Molybdopterin binding motif CinA N-terminal domain n=1 Tax=Paramagnetospirillum magnetotacticum MS-1 TaxID=272627 RepID=A0A0C2YIT3_PARME|nr:molybdopterin-binding protein [Paramagnetospirillum magnetotacticum]KIL99634.1 Molybdopterin binding motif CinA N-terminal domain [Paramagnetospirillum magnetotacticum MS-1]
MANAAILVIGNEILSGRTQDANVAYLGKELAARGITLAEVRIVRDDQAAIIAALDALRATHTYVFTSGGIGPTHDDITSAAIAKAFGVALERNPEAVRRLQSRYGEGELNAARLKMAEIPAGAQLVDNAISQAPGFRLDNVFVMAGVPSILRAMFEGIRHTLVEGPPQLSRSVTLCVREGDLAEGLARIQDRHPHVDVGSYPSFTEGRSLVSIVARGVDAGELDRVMTETRALAAELGAAVTPFPDESDSSGNG